MTIFERFLSKVDMSDFTGCHIWTAGRNKAGYGVFEVGGPRTKKSVCAHRFIKQIEVGRKLLTSEFVCHHCDNPACVNLAHLFIATAKENTRDMFNKGRWRKPSSLNIRRGDQHPARLRPERMARGEANGWSKLTEEAVRFIRESKAKGVDLASQFNVSGNAITRVRKHRTWRHVSP